MHKLSIIFYALFASSLNGSGTLRQKIDISRTKYNENVRLFLAHENRLPKKQALQERKKLLEARRRELVYLRTIAQITQSEQYRIVASQLRSHTIVMKELYPVSKL